MYFQFDIPLLKNLISSLDGVSLENYSTSEPLRLLFVCVAEIKCHKLEHAHPAFLLKIC